MWYIYIYDIMHEIKNIFCEENPTDTGGFSQCVCVGGGGGGLLVWRFHVFVIVKLGKLQQTMNSLIIKIAQFRVTVLCAENSFRVTVLCVGNSPVTGEFSLQRASNAENASSRLRHHVFLMIWDAMTLTECQSNTLMTELLSL